MKMLLKNLLMLAALSTAAVAAFAVDLTLVEKTFPLKDGTTVYIFKDGKMAMEDQYGRAARMKQGEVMETKDGQKILMHGDEVMLLNNVVLKKDGRGGGK